MPTGPKPKPLSNWIEPEPNSGCWLWTGSAQKDGRASIIRHINGKRKNLRVARLMWEETHGPIPDGLWVLHKCNINVCVNPDHLYLGTHQDNMRDMARSGVQQGKILKTHCPRGHPYDRWYFYGTRYKQVCLTCSRERCLAYYYARRRAQ